MCNKKINDYKARTWNGFCTLPEFYDSYLDKDAPVKITHADYIELATLASALKSGLPADTVAYEAKKSDMATKRSYCKDQRRNKTWQVGLLQSTEYELGGKTQPSIIDVDIDSIRASEVYQTFKGARFKKFEVEKGIGEHANNDFPLFRYADILLMKAEAIMRINANGGTPTSQIGVDPVALVNEVRARAGAELYTAGTLTFDELLAERGRELAWEGTRRTDLIRFDQFTKAWRFKGGTEPDLITLFPTGQSGRYRMLMPIPEFVINANPAAYTQNDGYLD